MTTDPYLAEPSLGTLVLSCENGYVLRSMEFGFPGVREAVVDRALADGTFDVTRFVSSRAVTLAFTIDGNKATRTLLVDRLRAFVFPRYRPWLYWSPDDLPQRRLRLRGVDAPVVIDKPKFCEVVAQWVSSGAPSDASDSTSGAGMIESAEESCRDFGPFGDEVDGRVYSWEPDRVYPFGGLAGAVAILNEGNAPADWRATVYGPAVNPWIEVNGVRMAFTITLIEGQHFVIDSGQHTITLDNGDSIYHLFDFTSGGWSVLDPGVNYVRWSADDGSTTDISRVHFCWRSTWS